MTARRDASGADAATPPMRSDAPTAEVSPRFTAVTIDHFQHPRNIGRLADADRVGRVDDAATDTMVQLFVKLSPDGRVVRATFRTFGCSACIAASSIMTELLIGRTLGAAPAVDAEDDRAKAAPDYATADVEGPDDADTQMARIAASADVPTSAELDAALGGLPDDKRYCADLVAEAARRLFTTVA